MLESGNETREEEKRNKQKRIMGCLVTGQEKSNRADAIKGRLLW